MSASWTLFWEVLLRSKRCNAPRDVKKLVMQLAKPTGYFVFSVLLIVYVGDEVLDIVTAADDCVVDGVSQTYGAAHDSGPVVVDGVVRRDVHRVGARTVNRIDA